MGLNACLNRRYFHIFSSCPITSSASFTSQRKVAAPGGGWRLDFRPGMIIQLQRLLHYYLRAMQLTSCPTLQHVRTSKPTQGSLLAHTPTKQVTQCEHLSALICNSTAHTVHLLQRLESSASSAGLLGGDACLATNLKGELKVIVSERSALQAMMATLPEALGAVRHALQLKLTECERLKQWNAVQGEKNSQARQVARRKVVYIRECSMRKIATLSRTLVCRRRLQAAVCAWREYSRAESADNGLVYTHKVQCCMAEPCIQCQDRRRPDFETHKSGKHRRLEDLEHVRITVKRLLHHLQAGHETGILGVAFGAGGMEVMEVVPHSPADECGRIKVGDRLLQIDGRAPKSLPPLHGEVGTTVDLTLQEAGSGMVKSVKLTRASATAIVINSRNIIESIDFLAQYVEAHCATYEALPQSERQIADPCRSERVQWEVTETAGDKTAAAQDKERKAMQEKEARLTFEVRRLKQELTERQVRSVSCSRCEVFHFLLVLKRKVYKVALMCINPAGTGRVSGAESQRAASKWVAELRTQNDPRP